MRHGLGIIAIVTCLSAPVSAQATFDCPQPPTNLAAGVWEDALKKSNAIARHDSSKYPKEVAAIVDAFYQQHPNVQTYYLRGSAFTYSLFRSSFCRAAQRAIHDDFEAKRRYASLDALLAKILRIGNPSHLN
jgi:hypothetical protein